jgi:hypothetical protein
VNRHVHCEGASVKRERIILGQSIIRNVAIRELVVDDKLALPGL